jgi:phage tail-like protein
MTTSVRFPALLPPHYARRDASGVWTRVLEAIGAVLDGMAADVEAFATLQDYLACDARYLPYLAQKLGWALDTTSPVELQRKMVGLLIPMYRERGTTRGIAAIVNLLLGLEVTIHEPWADGWRLGTALLGGDARLSPAIPEPEYRSPLPYTFYVHVPRVLTSAERAAATALIDFAKRAETHPVLVEPPPARTPWVLGRTRIGTAAAFGAGAQLVEGMRRAPAPVGFWGEDHFAEYVGGSIVLTVVASESRAVGPLVPGARYLLTADAPVHLRQGNHTVVATVEDFLLGSWSQWSMTPGRPSALHLSARTAAPASVGTLRIARMDVEVDV